MMNMQTARPVTKPTKQRKMLFQAPAHIRHKLFAASLSAELRATHGAKTFPVRSGDTVRIMRGDHKGFEGKITRVDTRKFRIYVEGLTREKVDGTTVFAPIHPSKVVITHLNLDDKWRKKVLERKKELRKKVEEAAEKPAKKPAEVAEIKEKAVEEKAAVEEKPKERKPRRKRKVAEKPAEEKKEERAEPEEKPNAKKPRAKRKTAKKTEGGA
jgi:large subunit ribosomal protein L24